MSTVDGFFAPPADLQAFYRHALSTVGGANQEDVAELPLELISKMFAPRMNRRLHECVVWWYLLIGSQIFREIEIEDGLLRAHADELITWFTQRQVQNRKEGLRQDFTLYHVLYAQITDRGLASAFHEVLDSIHINLDEVENPSRAELGPVLLWGLHALAVLDLFEQLNGADDGWPDMLALLQQQLQPEEMVLMYELLELMSAWLSRFEAIEAYQEGSQTGRTLQVILDYLSDHAYTSSFTENYEPRALSRRAQPGNLHLSCRRVWIA